MNKEILTILVPTYNRELFLRRLLDSLCRELAGLEDEVQVIVANNSSQDGSQAVIDEFLFKMPNLRVLNQAENVGPDENFCSCVERVQTPYFWLIGDDDLPKATALRGVVKILKAESPDLLYLNSEWLPSISSNRDGGKLSDMRPVKMSSEDFAGQVNVWVTFISSMVVNKQRLLALNPSLDIRRFAGTNLIQLGWIVPLLMVGDSFFFVEQRWILATSGNTGGYRLIHVFAHNFPNIIRGLSRERPAICRAIERVLAWSFIPQLLWQTRFGMAGQFLREDVGESLVPLRTSPAYWLVLLPLTVLPKSLAFQFLKLSTLVSKAIQLSLRMKFVDLRRRMEDRRIGGRG